METSFLPQDADRLLPHHGRKRARNKPKLHRLLLICFCSFFYLSLLLLAPKLAALSSRFSSFPFLYSFAAEYETGGNFLGVNTFLCSDVPNNSICCDRTTSFRSDVCIMRGDVRTRASSSALFLYGATEVVPGSYAGGDHRHPSIGPVPASTAPGLLPSVEKIRPYTRKWEPSVMTFVQELRLVAVAASPSSSIITTGGGCDVTHAVPAVVFSTGGYTGNVYHEFNDGIIPLYITSQGFHRKVVFVILDYHNWWITKYADVLSQLSEYPPVDFSGDNRTHCFPEAVVGLHIHNDLAIDPSWMGTASRNTNGRKPITILDFRNLLDRAYRPRIRSLELDEEKAAAAAKEGSERGLSPIYSDSVGDNTTTIQQHREKPNPPLSSIVEKVHPKLVIISRNGSRGIENEADLVSLCKRIGFSVLLVRPDRTTELAKIYRPLNQTDVMIGVHGAAMTHLLFLRPCSVFIQIVPLGTDWAAETYYGQPAMKLGLKYVAYNILPRESSLYTKYPRDHPVLRDPGRFTARGWNVTKEVYLEGQNVRLDLRRFLKTLARAYRYSVTRMRMRMKARTSS